MKELFTKNLDQLKHYRFYLSCNHCLYEQVIEVQNNINKKYFPRMKIYYEYYDFVNNSEKAQEYSQKLEELYDCEWVDFVRLLVQLIKQLEENYFYNIS